VTANDIRELLEVKHSKDLVVHEAPIGPAGSGQIDTWVMRKSWTQASVIGYEIKVSRSDFLGDNKWRKYLSSCNEFYFVVAPGVCDPREIPDGVGLMVVAKTGTRIFTKIKAPLRTEGVDGIEDVMRSVLMNRVVLTTSRTGGLPDTKERRMQRWRESLDNRHRLGFMVKAAISDEWDRLQSETDKANGLISRLNDFKERLIEHGFNPDASTWKFKRDLKNKIGEDLLEIIEDSIDGLKRQAERLRP